MSQEERVGKRNRPKEEIEEPGGECCDIENVVEKEIDELLQDIDETIREAEQQRQRGRKGGQ